MSESAAPSSSGSFEIRTSPTTGLRWMGGLVVASTGFMAFLAAGCLLALLTQQLAGTGVFAAVVVGGLGAYGVVLGVRAVRRLRTLGGPEVVARLDADGLHLHEGLGVPDLPEGIGWTTVPWAWVTSVSHTTLSLRSVKTLGAGDTPLEVLRFVLADDGLLDASPFDGPHLGVVGRMLAMTPTQVRTTLVAEAGGTDHAGALTWLGAHRPDLAVLTGATLPWSTRVTPDAWRDSPRVAVTGAHGRLGRRVVELLAQREKAPPVALLRNEAHRATLERAGAEVRMVDLDQGTRAIADALRGCAGVVHLAGTPAADVVEAARLARVDRFLVVSRGAGDDLGVVATSGLAWTAFRPGFLTDDAPTGEIALGDDVTPGPVPRADLAEVLVAAIRDEASAGAVWPIAGAPAAR